MKDSMTHSDWLRAAAAWCESDDPATRAAGIAKVAEIADELDAAEKPDTFAALRAANSLRHVEWTGAQAIDLCFRGVEMAGEAGEACNVIKKLVRARMGLVGSRATLADLAAELADVVICADLIAMDCGTDLGEAVRAKFNATSEARGLATRMVAA